MTMWWLFSAPLLASLAPPELKGAPRCPVALKTTATGANATGAKTVTPRAPGPRYFLGPGPLLF